MFKYGIVQNKIVHLDDNTNDHLNELIKTKLEYKVELGVVPDDVDDYFLNFHWRIRIYTDDEEEIIFNLVTETVYSVEFVKGTTTLENIGEIFRHALLVIQQTFDQYKKGPLADITLPEPDLSERLQVLYFEDLPQHNLL